MGRRQIRTGAIVCKHRIGRCPIAARHYRSHPSTTRYGEGDDPRRFTDPWPVSITGSSFRPPPLHDSAPRPLTHKEYTMHFFIHLTEFIRYPRQRQRSRTLYRAQLPDKSIIRPRFATLFLHNFVYLEGRPAKCTRASTISRQKGLLQLISNFLYPSHDVLYGFRHVVLRHLLQYLRGVGP